MHPINQERITIDWESCRWCDHWHAHDWAHRAPFASLAAHVDELLAILDAVLRKAAERGGPWQVWIAIDRSDSEQDAIYLHTPNPQTTFPERFEGVVWGASLAQDYRRLGERAEVGVDGGDGSLFFLTSPRWTRGLSLRP